MINFHKIHTPPPPSSRSRLAAVAIHMIATVASGDPAMTRGEIHKEKVGVRDTEEEQKGIDTTNKICLSALNYPSPVIASTKGVAI
ncbi:hypothetical protein HYZ70_03425 [Candidatus Curtissbacteria bacterium]|nr:hypothetical protein [Candidatus Curtissbacteria bacterium]